jgi:putative PIN family toxin of toxin-antitoxin system
VRIVLDTASFIAAVRSRVGAAREVVRLIADRQLVALMAQKLGLEYRDVALRPEHVAVSAMSSEEIVEFIHSVEREAESVVIAVRHRPLSPDPNDDMVLDVAINGRADAIVTMNKKHFERAAHRFGIAVLTPAELLGLLRGKANVK